MSSFHAGDATIRMVIDDAQLGGASARVRRSLSGVLSDMNKVQITAGQLFAVGAAAGGIGFGAFRFVKAYADAQETLSKFAAVFKEETDAAGDFAERFGDRIGRSTIGIKAFLATLQDTFVPLGFARRQSRELSQQVVELAFDLASFNNIPVADVVRDIQSALVGNTETLRKYGVVITQSTLDQQLLSDGHKGGVRAATEYEKALGRLNILLASTTDAQGDATRTAGSLANRFNALKEAASDAAIAIGESIATLAGEDQLGDVLETFTTKLRDFNDELERNSQARRELQQQSNDFGNGGGSGGTGGGRLGGPLGYFARLYTNAYAEVLGQLGIGLGESQRQRLEAARNLQAAREIMELSRQRANARQNEQVIGAGGFSGILGIDGTPLDGGAQLRGAIEALILDFISSFDGDPTSIQKGEVTRGLADLVQRFNKRIADATERGLSILRETIDQRGEQSRQQSREAGDAITNSRKSVLQQRAQLGDREAQLELELLIAQQEYLRVREQLLPIIRGEVFATAEQIEAARQALQDALGARNAAGKAARERAADDGGRGGNARITDPLSLVRDIQTQILSGANNFQERAAKAAEMNVQQANRAEEQRKETNKRLGDMLIELRNNRDGGFDE